VRTAKWELQRLKPNLFGRIYVVAKTTTHKDSAVLTPTLMPLIFTSLKIAASEETQRFCHSERSEESFFDLLDLIAGKQRKRDSSLRSE
jgi:hypothetical protein